MESVQIENVSDYVLMEIFKWLDAKSLLNTTLVCKRSNEVITGSVSALKPVTLILRKNKELEEDLWFRTIVEITMDRRRFSRIKLHSLFSKIDQDEMRAAVNAHRRTLTHVEFFNGEINLQSTMKNLTLIENLESITFDGTNVDSVYDEGYKAAERLKKLKHVKFIGINFEALSLLEASQLTSLEIVGLPCEKDKDLEELSVLPDHDQLELFTEIVSTYVLRGQLSEKRFQSTEPLMRKATSKLALTCTCVMRLAEEELKSESAQWQELNEILFAARSEAQKFLQDRMLFNFLLTQPNLKSLKIDTGLITQQTLEFALSIKSLKQLQLNGVNYMI